MQQRHTHCSPPQCIDSHHFNVWYVKLQSCCRTLSHVIASLSYIYLLIQLYIFIINIFNVLDENETFEHHDRTTAAWTTWSDGGVIGWTRFYWSVHLQVLHWLIVVDSMCFCTKRHETHRFIVTTQLHQTDGFIRLVLRSKPNQSVRSLITWSIQR